MADWLKDFGEVEDIFRIPDLLTGQPGDRGYIRFKEHTAAANCVKAGSATWSESERAISSQRSRRGGRESAYPDSMVARILGPRGDHISSVRADAGAQSLMLRGEGLGDHERMSSQRVHFVCKGTPEAIVKINAALEQMLAKVHEEITERLEAPDQLQELEQPQGGSAKKDRRKRSRSRGRRPEEPWRPPGGEPPGGPLPPWAVPPGAAGPPGGMPPPPPEGGWIPPAPAPWLQPPAGWGAAAAYGQPYGPPGAPPPPGGMPPPPGGPPGAPPPPSGPPPPGATPGAWQPPPPWAAGFGPHGHGPPPPWMYPPGGAPPGAGGGGPPGGPPPPEGAPPPRHFEAPPGRTSEPPPAGAAASGPSAGGAGGAGPPSLDGRNPGEFLADLPPQLTTQEQELASAVIEFLRQWASEKGDASHPNLVHAGADRGIRERKAAALPPEVALRSWIEQRLPGQVVLMNGRSLRLARPEDRAAAATTMPAASPAGGGVVAAVPGGGKKGHRRPKGERGVGSRSRSRKRRRRREQAAENAPPGR